MSFRLDYLYTSIIQRAGGKGEHLGEHGKKETDGVTRTACERDVKKRWRRKDHFCG